MKCAANADDLVLRRRTHRSRPATGELEGTLVGLHARVAEKDAVGERQVDQPLRQLLAGRRAEEVRDVDESLGRIVHDLSQARIAIA